MFKYHNPHWADISRAVTDHGERSRRAIIEAAAPIFNEHGYESASLNQIIRASGLTKGGFYFHFPSKQALACAVAADNQRRWMEMVAAEMARHRTSVDRLFAVPRFLARLTLEGEGPAAQHKLVDELARDPKLREEVSSSIRIWINSVADQFREAQRDGYIRADIDPEVVAEVAVGSFIGMQALTGQLFDGDLERRVEALIRVMQLATLVHPQGGRSK